MSIRDPKPGALTFLHLSDIHIGRNAGQAGDLDQHVRDYLIADIERVTQDIQGQIAAVLVCGDIAWSGQPGEYALASAWLAKVCVAFGVGVLKCVPGNHDVNREGTRDSSGHEWMGFVTMRRNLRKSPVNTLDTEFMNWMRDTSNSERIYKVYEAYNAFANTYGCHVSFETPYWEAGFDLNEGARLLIRGLDSALISNQEDQLDGGRMYLPTTAAQLPPLSNTVYVTMCHHPLAWIRNGDQIDRPLRAQARVQLFGHEHDQDVILRANSVQVFAGAVHPSRSEQHWEPIYNIITVWIETLGNERDLVVQIRPRKWIRNENTFGPVADSRGSNVLEYLLKLPTVIPPRPQPPGPAARGPAEAALSRHEVTRDAVVTRDPEVPRGAPEEASEPTDAQLLEAARKLQELPAGERLRVLLGSNLEGIAEIDFAIQSGDHDLLAREIVTRDASIAFLREVEGAIQRGAAGIDS